MTYGIIYVVENTINGKKYVGQTVQPLKVRWQRHCRKEQSGCVALASAIAKYGADAFKVSEVAQASTKEELNPRFTATHFLPKKSHTGGIFQSDQGVKPCRKCQEAPVLRSEPIENQAHARPA